MDRDQELVCRAIEQRQRDQTTEAILRAGVPRFELSWVVGLEVRMGGSAARIWGIGAGTGIYS